MFPCCTSNSSADVSGAIPGRSHVFSSFLQALPLSTAREDALPELRAMSAVDAYREGGRVSSSRRVFGASGEQLPGEGSMSLESNGILQVGLSDSLWKWKWMVLK